MEEKSTFKWRHPEEVMKLHQLKKRKKALQARIYSTFSTSSEASTPRDSFQNALATAKRKNPFINNSDNKRSKSDSSIDIDTSSDATLFKLLHCSSSSSKDANKENLTSFTNILSKVNETNLEVKADVGKTWIPIDWTLKTKIRFMCPKPFAWGQKLKLSEEASGITSFTRCLDTSNSSMTLDMSSNARFYQCCLYWQQPSLPWLTLFPRTAGKVSSSVASIATSSVIRSSLHGAWTDSLKSLFQLIRTRQCPYFYVCANHFTVLFRAAGICGFNDMHALVTPTTRGFRHALRQEDIEFKMPLKKGRASDQGYESQDSASTSSFQLKDECNQTFDEDEAPDEQWLQSMGIKAEDIKQINYTQARIEHKAECEVDNSEQSLILIEGLEVQGFYNFLMNCKSAIAAVGQLAGIPPTLLAPVAFHGASLNSLKVRESKVHVDDEDFYSIELSGPILPHTIHSLCLIHSPENSLTATFANVTSTSSFSKVKYKTHDNTSGDNEKISGAVLTDSGSAVFKKENLSDCGFTPKILKHFCSEDPLHVINIDCLKYTADSQTYTWT